MQKTERFWQIPVDSLLKKLRSSPSGLSPSVATKRVKEQRGISKQKEGKHKDLLLLLKQYKSPLVLLLVFAVALSLYLGEYSDSLIMLIVLLFTGLLGFIQERNAGLAVEKLRSLVHNKVIVRRGGMEIEIIADDVVPGDLVRLSAGDMVPGDGIIYQSNDLHINESVLTGESFPVEKYGGICSETSLAEVSNAVFKGTSVVNGSATILIVNTADHTELGKIAASIENENAESVFEKGIRNFGYMLMRISVALTGVILVVNLLLHKPLVDSVLFAFALAIGLTPELLPAIITITLATGAKRLAERKVIVKKLGSIQNLGEMEVLCSDKTGTITQGIVEIKDALGPDGSKSSKVLMYAFLNASFETGFSNPMDDALRKLKDIDIKCYEKFDEVPYDFIRKRLSVVVKTEGKHLMITKGALSSVLEVCTYCEDKNGMAVPIDQLKGAILDLYEKNSAMGMRTIALSCKDVSASPVVTKDDEYDMIFCGMLTLYDPPKENIIASISQLRSSGIALKMITGDNYLVARYLANNIGLSSTEILTGSELHEMTDEVLRHKVLETDVFAEVVPAQKERIVRVLKKNGLAVGYMGDGINDAGALKAADVGIAPDNAVDIAKDAADFVLLDKNIDVIRDGVLVGRNTFQNTMKYIFVATSANFGNMFSMAISSFVLPFLPLLPVQILLNNFLSDLPAIAISSDKVDPEEIVHPQKWDLGFIKRFMFIFGMQSSLFDILTFGLLIFVFHASPIEFRTAWFVESLLTQLLILQIIRTRRPFFRSQPSRYLLGTSVIVIVTGIVLPYLSVAHLFELIPLPFDLLRAILIIVCLYIIMAELTKRVLLNRIKGVGQDEKSRSYSVPAHSGV